MTTLEQQIDNLIVEGQKFTWKTFATFSPNNFPDAELPEFISWKIKTETLLDKNFGQSSSVFQFYLKHKQFHPLGNFGDQFDGVKNHIIGALQSAKELLDFKVEITSETSTLNSNKVFVVHGHDELLKNQTEIFLKELGLEAIILHRQADQGQTVIEKFEKNSDVAYAFILLTPDDVMYSASEEAIADSERRKTFIARQNVIFEFGFFIGKLGRNRVCCIYKEGVSVPTDLNGFIYKKVDLNIEEVAFSILKDLKATGMNLKL